MRCCSCLALAALACTFAAPVVADASPIESAPTVVAEPSPPTQVAQPTQPIESRRKRDRVRSLEVQAVGMAQLLPRPGGGLDVAFSFGFPAFQARVGAMVVGLPGFRLGEGEVANVLGTGTLDLCAAKQVLHHQIRMCVGGQAGGMAHRWIGYEYPGRKYSPWGAGTLKGDYQVHLTDHFGVVGAVGVVLPVLGPSFRGRDAYGSRSPQVFPGPMAGFLSVGTTFRW